MKKIFILFFSLMYTSGLFAQKDEGKRLKYQFNQRVGFYTVDDRYNLIADTIYHAFDGFHVWSGYDIEKFNNKDYIIFSYPDFGKGSTYKKISYIQVGSMMIDTLFLKKIYGIFDKDTISARIFKPALDSIMLYQKENLKKSVHVDIYGKDSLKLAMPKEEFDKLRLQGKIIDEYSLEFKHALSFATGFMTIPFKLRPRQDTINFNMTTDITLGAYLGMKKRISKYRNNYLIVPVTLGLSYINVGNSQTSNVNTIDNSSIVPGWTWSVGTVFDLNGFNIGCVLGIDYASGVGDNWLYNKKIWYSFSVGYSFFSKNEK